MNFNFNQLQQNIFMGNVGSNNSIAYSTKFPTQPRVCGTPAPVCGPASSEFFQGLRELSQSCQQLMSCWRDLASFIPSKPGRGHLGPLPPGWSEIQSGHGQPGRGCGCFGALPPFTKPNYNFVAQANNPFATVNFASLYNSSPAGGASSHPKFGGLRAPLNGNINVPTFPFSFQPPKIGLSQGFPSLNFPSSSAFPLGTLLGSNQDFYGGGAVAYPLSTALGQTTSMFGNLSHYNPYK